MQLNPADENDNRPSQPYISMPDPQLPPIPPNAPITYYDAAKIGVGDPAEEIAKLKKEIEEMKENEERERRRKKEQEDCECIAQCLCIICLELFKIGSTSRRTSLF